ncbi:MAG: hypothetical protein HOO96_17035 [Polyangiaceae bacterium]|nr:hypothetical protein [Polyangiaceae bacterium]
MRSLVLVAVSLLTGCTFLSGVDGYRTEQRSLDGGTDAELGTEADAGDEGAAVGDDAAASCFTLTVTATVPLKLNVGGPDAPVPYGVCLGAGTAVRIDKAQGPGDVSFSACPSTPLRAKRCEFAMPANDVTIHVQ